MCGLRDVLERLVRGEISIDEAERMLQLLAIEEIGEAARIDVGREVRRGVPEIILAEGKTEVFRRSGHVAPERNRKQNPGNDTTDHTVNNHNSNRAPGWAAAVAGYNGILCRNPQTSTIAFESCRPTSSRLSTR